MAFIAFKDYDRRSVCLMNHALFVKYKEVILYLFFGVMTTVVNILTFQLCRLFYIPLFLSNLIAWLLSVLVAFITNKLFVFESNNTSFSALLKEVLLFFMARVFSLGIDMLVIGCLVNIMMINELLSKIASNVIVIVVNYVLSKFIIFKK